MEHGTRAIVLLKEMNVRDFVEVLRVQIINLELARERGVHAVRASYVVIQSERDKNVLEFRRARQLAEERAVVSLHTIFALEGRVNYQDERRVGHARRVREHLRRLCLPGYLI